MNRGFSTIEIVIALAIAVVTISAVFSASFGFQSTVLASQSNNDAVAVGQGLIEQAQASAKNNFSSLIGSSGTCSVGVNCTTQVTVASYTDATTCTDPTLCKLVTALVSWLGEHNQSLSVTLKTIVTDPSSANTCIQSLSSDELAGWQNPQHYDFKEQDISGLPNSSNGLSFADLSVKQQYMYAVASTTANGNDTFYVLSLPTDPTQPPVYKNSISTGAGIGSNAIVVNGNYAYISDRSTANQLQVIDISTPSNPQVVSAAARKVSGAGGVGNSIFYYNNTVYLGLTRNVSGPEFAVYDVSTPTNPVFKGTEITNNADTFIDHDVNAISVKGDYAYLAHPEAATDANREQVTIIDINPTHANYLKRVGGFYQNGSSGGNGAALFQTASALYLGRTATQLTGSNDSIPEFYMLDSSNPPSSLSTVSSSYPLPAVGDSVNGVSARGVLAFLLTKNTFQVLNLTTPSSPVSWSTLPMTAFGNGAHGGSGNASNCSGRYLYLAISSSNGSSKGLVSVVLPGPIAVSAFTVNIHDTGHNVITQASAGDSVHAVASAAGSVGAPTGTVAFTFYGNGSCSGAGSSAGTVTLSNGVADPSTVQSSLVGGTYSFKAHYNGSYQYAALDSSCVSFPVVKQDQTITFPAIANKTYGDADFAAGASASSGLAVTLTSQTTGVCTIVGSNIHIVSTGTCTIQASQAGNASYNAAPNVSQSFAVNKASSATVITCPASVTYTGSAQTPCTAAVTGAGGLSTTASVSYTNNVNVGTASANATYAGDANHSGSSDAKTFAISKATPVITWANPAAITYGTALSATQLNATSGGVAGTFTYTPAAGTVLNAGANQTLSVHFVPTNTANYNTPADKTVTITVNKANQAITVTSHAPATAAYNSSFSVAANASSGLPVTYSVSGTGCTNAGSTITMGGPSCTVRYDQAGNANYNAAPQVTETAATPAFTYTIANSASQITLTRGGASVNLVVTVTMAAGAFPQQVSMTAPTPKNNINVTTNPLACTPNGAAPYQCTVTFVYSAANGVTGTYTNQTVSGTPNAVLGTPFSIKVQ